MEKVGCRAIGKDIKGGILTSIFNLVDEYVGDSQLSDYETNIETINLNEFFGEVQLQHAVLSFLFKYNKGSLKE